MDGLFRAKGCSDMHAVKWRDGDHKAMRFGRSRGTSIKEERANEHCKSELAFEKGEMLSDTKARTGREAKKLPALNGVAEPTRRHEFVGLVPKIAAMVNIAHSDSDRNPSWNGNAVISDDIFLERLASDNGNDRVKSKGFLENSFSVGETSANEFVIGHSVLNAVGKENTRFLKKFLLDIRIFGNFV